MAQTTRSCTECGAQITSTGRARSICSAECRRAIRARRERDSRARIKRLLDQQPRCSVAECSEPSSHREWCEWHYRRWLKTGSTTTPRTRIAPTPNVGLTCSIDDCDKPRRKREWCLFHYGVWKRHGDPLVPVKRWKPRTAECRMCGLPTVHAIRNYCSENCQKADLKAALRGYPPPVAPRPCGVCGAPVPTVRRNGKAVRPATSLVCVPCRQPKRKHGVTARSLAEERGTRCGFCGLDVDMALRKPDPMRASVDHVIPRSRGGTDERSNLQLCHLRCNSIKGARLIA